MKLRRWTPLLLAGFLLVATIGVSAASSSHDTATPVAPTVPTTPSRPTTTGTVEDGVRVFRLDARAVTQQIAHFPKQRATVWGYDGSTPGPTLVAYEGEPIRVELTNDLEVPTTLHFHGAHAPNDEDGVAGITQVDLVEPGETYPYAFTPGHAGTFAYHAHTDGAVQELRGLVGVLVVLPRSEPASRHVDDDVVIVLQEFSFEENGQLVDPFPPHWMYHTMNGKTGDAAEEPITVDEGDRVRVRLYNASNQSHPIHLHGHDITVVSKNGHPVPTTARSEETVQNVAPGDFYEIEFDATNPGNWLLHCHIPHHTTNAHESGWKGAPVGMSRVIHYRSAPPVPEQYYEYDGS